jgi:TATA-box binding protein (TBP) (component of TFIID and TFIIIB)
MNITIIMLSCDDEWAEFTGDNDVEIPYHPVINNIDIPKCSELYISTKTMIVYVSQPINLKDTFWGIDVMPYNTSKNGVIKKIMKYNFQSRSEVTSVSTRLEELPYWSLQILKQHNKYQNSEIERDDVVKTDLQFYTDVRKITIGMSKKDITSFRTKPKSAFYNCYVLIYRMFDNNINGYREHHVKIFNTGKIELPGVKTNEMQFKLMQLVINTIKKHSPHTDIYYNDFNETVLINSNFNCGFNINREKLSSILKYKYKLHTSYDPCSYPGIMSKYVISSTCKVSFMIFRTGSVLIVGKCQEEDLNIIYLYLSDIFVKEYHEIYCPSTIYDDISKNITKSNKKIKRKTIIVI